VKVGKKRGKKEGKKKGKREAGSVYYKYILIQQLNNSQD
jgi:hypothetical protein